MTTSSMITPMPTMIRNAKNGGPTGGRRFPGPSFKPLIAPAPGMGENETAEIRNLDGVVHDRGGVVGNAEQSKRRRLGGVVAALDRRQLGRLIFERIEAVLVAEKNLQRYEQDQQTERHAHHHP